MKSSQELAGALEACRYLIAFRGGPVWRIEESLQIHAETLALGFSGVIFAAGVPQEASFGSVRVVCNPIGKRLPSKVVYAYRVLRQALTDRKKAGKRPVIVTYDPLRNGLIGLALRGVTGGHLICQVNGVHTNPDILGDAGQALSGKLRIRAMRTVARYVLNRCDGIKTLFPTQLNGYGIALARQVVRSYFDLVRIDRFPNLGEEKTILFVGYPFRLKGVDILLDAFAGVRADFPDWKLILIGFDLAKHVDEHMADKTAIEVIPAMSNEKVASWIGRCGIFVLPSRTEAMGRVLLEAGAAGKPRIGSEVDGIPTVIEHDQDGLLFPKGDSSALADCLKKLMASKSERERLGEAAARRVREDFSPERFLEYFTEHVDAVCASSSRGAVGQRK